MFAIKSSYMESGDSRVLTSIKSGNHLIDGREYVEKKSFVEKVHKLFFWLASIWTNVYRVGLLKIKKRF